MCMNAPAQYGKTLCTAGRENWHIYGRKLAEGLDVVGFLHRQAWTAEEYIYPFPVGIVDGKPLRPDCRYTLVPTLVGILLVQLESPQNAKSRDLIKIF